MSEPAPWVERDLGEELWFAVRFRPANRSGGEVYSVEFEAYKVTGREPRGKAWFARDNERGADDPTDKLEDADRYLRGEIKWDGCSHWYFDEQDRVMLHLCGRDAALDIGRLFEAMFDIARELMPDMEQT